MMSLPPGLRYTLRQLPNIIIPPAIVYASSYIAREYFQLSPPTWLLVLLTLFSWPIAFTALVQYHDYANLLRARTLGAVIPREISHKWPGSIDVLKRIFALDNVRYLGHSLFEWREEYGNIFNFRVMFEDRIFTTEPDYIKMILATEFNHYEKGPLLWEQLNTLLGYGVFNSDGEMWKFHRTMTRPFFSRDRITEFDIFDRHAEHALNKVTARTREGIPVDWQDVVSRFTMDSATEFLFGKDVRSLDAPLPYPSTYAAPTPFSGTGTDAPSDTGAVGSVHPADRFVRAFQSALEATATRGRFLQSWPLFEFWGDKVKQHLTAVDEFIDPIVEDALRKKSEKASAGDEEDNERKEQVRDDETLLQHLVKFTDDHKVIKDETLNILLAGRDTTSCTLTFAVYALAEHPEVLKRLRAEVLSVVGPSQRPTYDNVREMKYMRAFTNEVLRLWPPVPVNSRCSIRPMTWKSKIAGEPDIYIPPRTRCLYSVLLMHRRKDLWGPDALMFDPDRFLDERVQKYLLPNPFIFLPFNAGPRICLGQQFAYNEMSFMLTRLLQRFSGIALRQDAHPAAAPPPGVERSPYAVDGRERVWMRSHLTTYAKNGLWVEMEEASQE
uniref:Cytochrome P450 monooxygenase n=1 Tax=Trametes versicolor TaxID=5325 RepID=A0AA86IVZ6_TRAVE|nr:cytochrome P450 monooxygenase [Trametes versicolor]